MRRRSGDLVSALLGDVELIELFYAHTISPLFVAILVPGGVLIALGVLAPRWRSCWSRSWSRWRSRRCSPRANLPSSARLCAR